MRLSRSLTSSCLVTHAVQKNNQNLMHFACLQMHLTFWKLSHMILVAMLCTIWGPGDVISCYMAKCGPENDALGQRTEKVAHVQVPLLSESRLHAGIRKVA